MKIRVLGCSGGIGGRDLRTTSLLVDHDILIDAGTGLTDLPLAELALIDHVFVTHSHLDHIAALPLMIDSVADLRTRPVMIYATGPTLDILRNHVFNWAIWPDFSEISIRDRAVMRYVEISAGQEVSLGEGRRITAVPAEHSVPAVGYHLDSGAGSLVFSGDTTVNERLWPVLEGIDNLRYLIVETAFSDRDKLLASVSQHLCPGMLCEELAKLSREVKVFVTHVKPGQAAAIMKELGACADRFKPELLRNDQIIEF